MASVKKTERPVEQHAATPLSEEDKQALLAEEIEKSERLAASQLEMAQLFLKQGKTEIARRRLRQILEQYPKALVVPEAERLLNEQAA